MSAPSTTEQPEVEAPAPGRRRLRRAALVVGLVVAGLAAVVAAADVRSLEATAMATVVGRLTASSTHVASNTAGFYWLMGTTRAQGLRITSECSIAYVVGPLLVLCGALAALRRLPARRVLAAAAVGVSLITVVNLLRMTMVAIAITHQPGEQAMWWWHSVAGSIVSIGGIGVGLAAVIRVAFGGSEDPPRRASPPPAP